MVTIACEQACQHDSDAQGPWRTDAAAACTVLTTFLHETALHANSSRTCMKLHHSLDAAGCMRHIKNNACLLGNMLNTMPVHQKGKL
ncbi:hypothetical protein DUNSADRAFT_13985 [Dunaliella salina]|uniref:Encoded protein n=1 Tax=Dunaliella salina TaxID=3046 RepID=A0ABQ7G877_DUNSA|nr:hypothetical protein DUNSADRAFT_13985 [Dunaliella salina]|eukprot:KAF5830815.1 hypothetical protein DUNSADRAFT_13985 [Dunaliella salina]